MSSEKILRALPTHPLSINLPVTVAGVTGDFLLVDLSTLGMKLGGTTALTVGDTYTFLVDLGVLPTFSPPRLTLRGEVRWNGPDSVPGRTVLGVRFESLAPEVHVVVDRIIDRLAL